MRRMLVTWSDRGIDGPAPAHQVQRPTSDRGPVLRLLDETTDTYHHALVLTVHKGLARAHQLADDLRARVREVEVRAVDVEDPSDYGALFAQLVPLAGELERAGRKLDVLLSSGTPQ